MLKFCSKDIKNIIKKEIFKEVEKMKYNIVLEELKEIDHDYYQNTHRITIKTQNYIKKLVYSNNGNYELNMNSRNDHSWLYIKHNINDMNKFKDHEIENYLVSSLDTIFVNIIYMDIENAYFMSNIFKAKMNANKTI